jgi:peroxiredoxin
MPSFAGQIFGQGPVTSDDLSTAPTLLSFHRYAACPVCTKNLAPFRVRHGEIARLGIRMLAVFHSPVEKLERYFDARDLPFEVIADPSMELYVKFGLQEKLSTFLNPGSIKGLAQTLGGPVAINPFKRDGPLGTIPADFLFDGDGRLVARHYGENIDDSWTVDDVLKAAAPLQQATG